MSNPGTSMDPASSLIMIYVLLQVTSAHKYYFVLSDSFTELKLVVGQVCG